MNKEKWVFVGVYLLIIIAACVALTSCSSVRKSQSAIKTEVEIKKDEVKNESVDSSVTIKTKIVEVEGNTITVEFDSTKQDSAFEIIVTPTKPSDYFEPSIKIKSSSKPKKITIKSTKEKEDSKEASTNISKDKEEVKKEEVKIATIETNKNKTKVTFQWWWLILIGGAVMVFIKRKPIWRGLKAIISPIKL